MQTIKLNPETGDYEIVDWDGSNQAISAPTAVAEEEEIPTDFMGMLRARDRRRAAQEEAAVTAELDAASKGEDDRPVFANSLGMAVSDTAKILGNAGVALATDYVDIGYGVADILGQTYQLATGQRKSYDANDIFNDSDNDLTRMRREAFKTESQAGQTVSNIFRLGLSLIALPKLAVKGLKILPKIGQKIPGVKGVATKALGGIDKADKALNVSTAPKVTKAMQGLEATATSAGGKAAAARVAKNDWLTYTYQDIAKSAEATNWWRGVSNSAAALTSIKKVKGAKAKIRTVAEAIGWDAFVAFNVFGEGQYEFDETFTDFLAASGLPNIGYFETDIFDSSIEIKWKQMLEGVIIGAPLAALIDMARIRKFAKAFNSASDADKKLILEAFNAEADELGRSTSRLFDDIDQGSQGASFNEFASDWANATGFYNNPRAEAALRQRLASGGLQGPMAPPDQPLNTYGLYPQRGGALARLNDAVNAVDAADQNITNATAAAGLIGESPQAVNAQIAATRAGQAPVPEFGPSDPLTPTPEWKKRFPSPGPAPVPEWERQFPSPGPAPTPQWNRPPSPGLVGSTPAEINAQTAAVRAGQAPIPEFGTPQFAERGPIGRRDNGPGLVGSTPAEINAQTAAVRAGQAPVPEFGTPQFEERGAIGRMDDPAGLYGESPQAINAQIAATRARQAPVPEWNIPPRNPELVVTPQAVKTAFDEDTAAVFKEAVLLEADEVIPDQLQRITDEVTALAPKTRVDAVEFIAKNPLTTNELGVIEASESLRANYLVERGLAEGWAKVDENMDIQFTRQTAAQLDRNELAENSAKAIDEAVDNEIFEQSLNQRQGLSYGLTGEERISTAEKPKIDDQSENFNWNAEVEPSEVDAALKTDVVKAKVEEERFEAAEQLRLSPAEDMAVTGGTTDEQLVAEMLGIDLNKVQPPDVEKAANGRKWAVLDDEGNELITFTRKSQADKYANKQVEIAKKDLIRRAKQVEADGGTQALEVRPQQQITESDLTGKVSLSPAQEAMLRVLLKEQFGEQLTKKTFSFTLTQMNEGIAKLKELIQAGDVSGNQLRVARNTIDKLEVQTKILAPRAASLKSALKKAEQVNLFLQNGEFC